jgi:Ca2+-binding EF-hand superfamily protein
MKKAILPALLALALATPAVQAATRKLDGKFDRADLNSDNQLTPAEFQATQKKRISVAYSLFRFNKTDTNNDGFVSLEEFRISKGGVAGGKPTKMDLFLLADADNDDVLDPTEYVNTLPSGSSYPKALKSFDKRDKDDTGTLTPKEFGVGNNPGFPFP